MVSSQLDYCNSILYGTSSSNLNKLQRVQNAYSAHRHRDNNNNNLRLFLD